MAQRERGKEDESGMKARKERERERVKYRPDYWNNVVSCLTGGTKSGRKRGKKRDYLRDNNI